MEQNKHTLLKGFNFIGLRRIGLIIVLVFIGIGLGSYSLFKGFTLGTDFSGGLRIEFTAPTTIQDIRESISGERVSLTTLKTDGIESFLLTAPADKGDLTQAYLNPLKEKYGAENVTIVSSSFVGPSVGYDFSLQALRLVGIVVLLILIYVAFRFDYMYGIGAIIASLHDIMIMLVVTLALRLPIDLTVLAAFLTILGYSINDTIVIFDRVRENHTALPEEDLAPIMNKSISQCMTRTILTSLTTLFVATSIYVWSGAALKNFGLLMIVGIISGTYSSIFVASPITHLIWKAKHRKSAKKSVGTVAK